MGTPPGPHDSGGRAGLLIGDGHSGDGYRTPALTPEGRGNGVRWACMLREMPGLSRAQTARCGTSGTGSQGPCSKPTSGVVRVEMGSRRGDGSPGAHPALPAVTFARTTPVLQGIYNPLWHTVQPGSKPSRSRKVRGGRWTCRPAPDPHHCPRRGGGGGFARGGITIGFLASNPKRDRAPNSGTPQPSSASRHLSLTPGHGAQERDKRI